MVEPRTLQQVDLQSAIVNVFDHLYSFPLFRVRAFIRSSVFTTTVFISCSIYLAWKFGFIDEELPYFAENLLAIIFSDYVSLFGVRRCLVLARGHLLASLFLATAIGIIVVTVCFIGTILPELWIKGLSFNRALGASLNLFIDNVEYGLVGWRPGDQHF
jgi:hypothetical protein